METISKALCALVLKLFHVVCFWRGGWAPFSWYWSGQEEALKGDYPCCTFLWGWGSCLRWIGGRVVWWFFGHLFFLWQNLGYHCFQAWQRNWIVSYSLWLLNLSKFEHFRSCIPNFFLGLREKKVLVLPIKIIKYTTFKILLCVFKILLNFCVFKWGTISETERDHSYSGKSLFKKSEVRSTYLHISIWKY